MIVVTSNFLIRLLAAADVDGCGDTGVLLHGVLTVCLGVSGVTAAE